MGTRYTMCESDVLNRIQKVMQAHHGELAKAGVTVDAVFAIDPDGPAIRLHGYACAATIKKVGYKQRVLGRADSEMTIDQAFCNDATDDQKDGLIDHELTHLEVIEDARTRIIKRDAAGRPRLAMRLHDWELGGFEDTARRYGKAAPEVKAAQAFKLRFGQLCFDFHKARGEAA